MWGPAHPPRRPQECGAEQAPPGSSAAGVLAETSPSSWRRGVRRQPAAKVRPRRPSRRPFRGPGPRLPAADCTDGEPFAGARGPNTATTVAAPSAAVRAPGRFERRRRCGSPSHGAGRGLRREEPARDIRFRGRGLSSSQRRSTAELSAGSAFGLCAPCAALASAGLPAASPVPLVFPVNHAGAPDLAAHADGLQGPEAG